MPPANRTVTFTYVSSSSKQVLSIADATGTFATYTYDTSLLLTQVTWADSSFNTFTYDQSNHNLLSVMDTAGKVLESHTYDTQHRGLTSQGAGGAELVTSSPVNFQSAIFSSMDAVKNREARPTGPPAPEETQYAALAIY